MQILITKSLSLILKQFIKIQRGNNIKEYKKVFETVTSRFPNGKIHYCCKYKNGVLHGESIVWWENGQIGVKCNYKYGKYDKWYIAYDWDARVRHHCYYKDDVEVKTIVPFTSYLTQ